MDGDTITMHTTDPYSQLSDIDFAQKIAVSAGNILNAILESQLLRGHQLGDVGDSTSQGWLEAVLRQHRPADAILSEEAWDNKTRLSADRVWIIDPLDGTREFRNYSPDWAVHIGLWERNKPLSGVVYAPATGALYSSAHIHNASIQPLTGKAVMSPSSRSILSRKIALESGLEPIYRGGAGIKAMLVVSGHADAYIHVGGQYEWDSCAPVAIANQAGLHCSRIDGSPLQYNELDTYLPDFVICQPRLAQKIIATAHRIIDT